MRHSTIAAVALLLSCLLAEAPVVGQDAAAPGSSGSLVVGPCDRSAQDNPTFTACLRAELNRLAPVVERYAEAKRIGLRTAAADAAADGHLHDETSYKAALEQFDIAQTAWERYRDAHCTMMGKQITGSGAPAAPVRCHVLLTYDRLQQIWQGGFTDLPDPASSIPAAGSGSRR